MNQKPSQPGARPDGQSFGTRLRSERELREITLADIALQTKVHTRYLSAIEENRFEDLPGGIFTRNFLRSYAQVLGLDPEQVLLDYQVELQIQGLSTEPAPLKPIKVVKEGSASKTKGTSSVLWLLLVFVVIGGGLMAYGMYRSKAQHQLSPKAVPAPPENPASVQEDPVPGPPETMEATSQETSLAEPELLGLTLEFLGECWLELEVDGQRKQKKTMSRGDILTYNGEQFRVVLGDPASVKASFHGRPFDLAGTSGKRYQATWNAQDLTRMTEEQEATP